MASEQEDEPKGKGKLYFYSHPMLNVCMVGGVAIILAGIYFESNGLTSSGPTMDRSGAPYGTGTLDGMSMIFCGAFILLLALAAAIQRKKSGSK